MADPAALPPLPPIHSAPVRKQVFIDISVYRLASDASAQELDRVENTDNNRLSFLGRATLEYALATSTTDSFPDESRKLEDGLAECARAYDIVKLLNVAWRGSSITGKEVTRWILPPPYPPPPQSEIPPPGPPLHAPTGLLHDVAKQHAIQLVWEDRSTGPRHAQEWISDVTLKDTKSDRIWPCIARGMGMSKKLARADAAAKVLLMWSDLGFK
ncbi:hypothetical protein OPQ81_008987 [Rhizoctonia solani]|nr:hypothetical protein OPQ81_008987 [Rhizoctonia solani]